MSNSAIFSVRNCRVRRSDRLQPSSLSHSYSTYDRHLGMGCNALNRANWRTLEACHSMLGGDPIGLLLHAPAVEARRMARPLLESLAEARRVRKTHSLSDLFDL